MLCHKIDVILTYITIIKSLGGKYFLTRNGEAVRQFTQFRMKIICMANLPVRHAGTSIAHFSSKNTRFRGIK